MKNKIVKALVLASIVSMTATGAAGLTFANDTGSGSSGSVESEETTETTKSIDDLAKGVTDAQTAVDKAKAEFDKAYAYYEAQEKAREAYNTLVAQESKTRVDFDTLGKTYFSYTGVEPMYVEGVDKLEADAFRNLESQYGSLQAKEDAWANDVAVATIPSGRPQDNDVQGATTDSTYKKKYDDAKDRLDYEKSSAFTKYDAIKDGLEKAFDDEKTAREAFEAAMAEVEAMEAPENTQALEEKIEAYKQKLDALTDAKTKYDAAVKDMVPIYRLYHPGTGEHLYTNSTNERDTLVKGGIWQDEKVAMLTLKKTADDAIPVYRLCYPLTGDHHYTTDLNEVKTLIKTQGWVDEHDAFYVPKENGVTVYRLYNKGLKLGAHHYTTGLNEYNTLKNHGWLQEGEGFKAVAKDYVDTSAIADAIKAATKRIAAAEKLLN